jgi:hypothetical protein
MRKTIPILPDPSREPAHPGAILCRFVPPDLNRPMTEIARALGISRQLLVDMSGIPTLAAPSEAAE